MNERCSACNGMKGLTFNYDTVDGPVWKEDMWVEDFATFRDKVDDSVIHIAKVVCLRCGILFDGSGLV